MVKCISESVQIIFRRLTNVSIIFDYFLSRNGLQRNIIGSKIRFFILKTSDYVVFQVPTVIPGTLTRFMVHFDLPEDVLKYYPTGNLFPVICNGII